MTLEQFLEDVVKRLEEQGVEYALAGGLAVTFYRAEPRITNDLDFIIGEAHGTKQYAKQFIEHFGLTARSSTKADLDGGPMFAIKRRSSPVCIVVGRNPEEPSAIGLDFILPEMPWVKSALERAQHHLLDFGFTKIPTLTLEDVILAKLSAIEGSKKREKDIDDLRSILSVGHELDVAYLIGQMNALDLTIPKVLDEDVPDVILKASKQVRLKR